MFNFTTQTVFNKIEENGPNQNLWVTKDEDENITFLRIGNIRFVGETIASIEKKVPTEESLAKVTFDMSKILLTEDTDPNEGTARIALYIGLSMNSQDAFYSNDLVYKGKPLYIEFPVKKGDTAAVVAKRVKSIADKYLLFVTQEKLLDVTVDGGNVTITGVNGYQLIKYAALQKYDEKAKTVDCCTTQGDFVDVVVGVPVAYKTDFNGSVISLSKKILADGTFDNISSDTEVEILPGLEAFGDYNWIIHNLRLPTAANTNFWAPTRAEMPVPGQTYVQFIVRMCAERDGIAGEVVGQRATSVTTHVLYVAKPYADTVATALGNLENVGSEADTKLLNPYGYKDGGE